MTAIFTKSKQNAQEAAHTETASVASEQQTPKSAHTVLKILTNEQAI